MALASNPGLVPMPDAKTRKKRVGREEEGTRKKGEGNKKKQVGGPSLLPFSLRARASFLLFRSFFSRLRLKKGAGSPPPFSSAAADTNNGWPKTEIEIHGKGGKREREEKKSSLFPLPSPPRGRIMENAQSKGTGGEWGEGGRRKGGGRMCFHYLFVGYLPDPSAATLPPRLVCVAAAALPPRSPPPSLQ